MVYLSDPIGDFCARIKNAYQVNKKAVSVPYSKIKEEIAKILVKAGYLDKVSVKPLARNKKLKTLEIALKYKKQEPVLTEIKRVSKPGVRIYLKKEKIKRVLGGLGLMILSTSQGLMTGKEARKKGLGGEVICKVW